MSTDLGLFPWAAYGIDAWQRSILFLDVLRQRGNAFLEREDDPMRHVLSFEFEVVMDGRSVQRPVNYWMARIAPPAGAPATDLALRPFIVIDPRAGHGPGIGGFKADSEIGVAVKAGHPCYFVGFRPEPEPGQTIEDVVRALVAFAEEVGRRHARADGKPLAIGNCQAGWMLMMAAAIRPEAFGPLMVAGSPLAYWAGVPGKAPMRYLGGLLGGSWLTAMTGDLGAGKFDGAWLVTNFESGNPANTYWTKQAEVWSNVDKAAARYLGFEKWWGGHVTLNAEEMQFIVDQLFVGNRLATGELTFSDGTRVDLRNIASPIIVFCSQGDDITPPAQALSWIGDLYTDLDDLRTHGQTIVYSVHDSIGHLGIFVSGGVAKKEHNEFATNMDLIDVLPPGLYEAMLEPGKGLPGAEHAEGDWVVSFESRDLKDLAAHGGTDPDDERRFAEVRRVSEANLALYRTVAQPVVRAVATPPVAEALAQLHPARLGYTLFSDRNPWMAMVRSTADMVRGARQPVADDNPGRVVEHAVSDSITRMLTAYGRQRDTLTEQLFRQVYDSPVVQALTGVAAATVPPRLRPGASPDHQRFVALATERLRAAMAQGGLQEAVLRALLWIRLPAGRADERAFGVIRRIRQAYGRDTLPLAEFKRIMREQFYMLLVDEEAAIAALPALLPADPAQRAEAFAALRSVVAATGEMPEVVAERLAAVERIFLGAAPPTVRKLRPRDSTAAWRHRQGSRHVTSTTDAAEMLVGLSREEAIIGLTATAEHRLGQRAFDLAAALFGAPEGRPDALPDAALALIVQSILFDFTARRLPGPGCQVLGEELRFVADPVPGDVVTVTGTVTARPTPETATIAILAEALRGRLAEGMVTVRLPAERVSVAAEARPAVVLHRHRHLARLMARGAEVPPLAAAIAWPCDRDSLVGALQAARDGALQPILVGPRAEMAALALAAGTSLGAHEIVEAETPQAAAAVAVRLCREGRAAALMKGSLHTDELIAAVVAREGGLRGTRRISHVFAMDVPSYPKPLFITDAAINIAPDLATKADIIRNAVDLLHALGNPAPKVAILSAVETVNPKIPSTLDAAALCKMADRGQIAGAVLDGPLAFDNAISRAAAAVKKIASPVAGDADILVAPDLEAGNMIAKQLSYLAHASSAGIVLGTRVPVILTSRADSVETRLASIALARLLAAART